MKQILIILGLLASVTTFAQSPRIKLNQITKDSVTGSVLISSPTDSGMVYSRDLFISYGADTFLILYGDTLAATSGIISSVLSDGVTITGDGTSGNELKVDTANVIATKQDLDLYYLDSNPDGYTSNTGTVTSVGGTGTVNGISLSGTVTSTGNLTLGGTLSNVNLASQVTGTLPIANGGTGSATQNFVDLTNAQTIGGAKIFTSTLTGTSNLIAPKIQVGTSATINDVTGVANTLQLTNYSTGAFITGSADNYIYKNSSIFGGLNAHTLIFQTRSDVTGGGFAFVGGSTPSAVFTIRSSGNVGIGTTSPTAALDLKAGTASANTAPLKFTSGTNLTSPEAGAMEWNGTNLFLTNSSATRQTIAQGLTGSATLDFGSISADSYADLTLTVTGASDGDVVAIGVPNGSVANDVIFTAWVSAANTVTIRATNNNSTTARDPASGTFKAFVYKF